MAADGPNIDARIGSLLEEGNFQELVRVCRHELLVRPSQTHVRRALGRGLLLLRRWDEAIAELTTVVRAAPSDWMARRYLGEACLRAGRRFQANEHLRVARELAPGDEEVERLIAESAGTDPSGELMGKWFDDASEHTLVREPSAFSDRPKDSSISRRPSSQAPSMDRAGTSSPRALPPAPARSIPPVAAPPSARPALSAPSSRPQANPPEQEMKSPVSKSTKTASFPDFQSMPTSRYPALSTRAAEEIANRTATKSEAADELADDDDVTRQIESPLDAKRAPTDTAIESSGEFLDSTEMTEVVHTPTSSDAPTAGIEVPTSPRIHAPPADPDPRKSLDSSPRPSSGLSIVPTLSVGATSRGAPSAPSAASTPPPPAVPPIPAPVATFPGPIASAPLLRTSPPTPLPPLSSSDPFTAEPGRAPTQVSPHEAARRSQRSLKNRVIVVFGLGTIALVAAAIALTLVPNASASEEVRLAEDVGSLRAFDAASRKHQGEVALAARLSAMECFDHGTDAACQAITGLPNGTSVEERLAKAYAALIRGDSDGAATALGTEAPVGETLAEWRRAWALTRLLSGDLEGALREARAAAEERAGSPRHAILLARLYALKADGSRANASLGAVSAAHKNSPAMKIARARVAQILRLPVDSLAGMDTLRNPSRHEQIQAALLTGTLRIEEATRTAPPADEDFVLAVIEYFASRSEWRNAKAMLGQLPAQSVQPQRRAIATASVFIRCGDLDRADQLLAAASHSPETSLWRGISALERGSAEQARALLTEAARVAPTQSLANRSLVELDVYLGKVEPQPDDAYVRDVTGCWPSAARTEDMVAQMPFPPVSWMAFTARHAAANGDLNEAREWVRRLLDRAPHYVETAYAFAVTAVESGDGDAAYERVAGFAEAFERAAAISEAAGCLALQADRDAEASRHFERARSRGMAATGCQAEAWIRRGDLNSAARLIEYSLAERLGDRAEWLALRARLAFENGNFAEATRFADEALEESATYAPAHYLKALIALERDSDATELLERAMVGRRPPAEAFAAAAIRSPSSPEVCEWSRRYLAIAPRGYDAERIRRLSPNCN